MSSFYKRHRFPAKIISYCVWLYYTFPLSFKDIEKMMLYRGIEVTYESIREWGLKFAQSYANQIHRRRPKPADKWISMKSLSRLRPNSTICSEP